MKEKGSMTISNKKKTVLWESESFEVVLVKVVPPALVPIDSFALARCALSRVVLNCVNSFLSWKLNERTVYGGRGRGYSRQTRIPTMRRGDSLFMVQKLRRPSPAMQVSLVSRLIFILCFRLFDPRPNKEW